MFPAKKKKKALLTPQAYECRQYQAVCDSILLPGPEKDTCPIFGIVCKYSGNSTRYIYIYRERERGINMNHII